MVWLEVYPWWAESWEWHVGWEHRGLSGPQLRAQNHRSHHRDDPTLETVTAFQGCHRPDGL